MKRYSVTLEGYKGGVFSIFHTSEQGLIKHLNGLGYKVNVVRECYSLEEAP